MESTAQTTTTTTTTTDQNEFGTTNRSNPNPTTYIPQYSGQEYITTPQKFLKNPTTITVFTSQIVLSVILVLIVLFYSTLTPDITRGFLWGGENAAPPTPTPTPTPTPSPQPSSNPKTVFKIDRTGCPIMCPMMYQPVCGSDGNTYGNACQLTAFNKCERLDGQPPVTQAHEGSCSDGLQAGDGSMGIETE